MPARQNSFSPMIFFRLKENEDIIPFRNSTSHAEMFRDLFTSGIQKIKRNGKRILRMRRREAELPNKIYNRFH